MQFRFQLLKLWLQPFQYFCTILTVLKGDLTYTLGQMLTSRIRELLGAFFCRPLKIMCRGRAVQRKVDWFCRPKSYCQQQHITTIFQKKNVVRSAWASTTFTADVMSVSTSKDARSDFDDTETLSSDAYVGRSLCF